MYLFRALTVPKHACATRPLPSLLTDDLTMNLTDMNVQPGYLIRRAHQKASAAFESAMADLDITAVQFSALVVIKERPDIEATRVSEIVSFDRTTIGHVLGRLERKKLIVRTGGTVDRRTKHLRITLKGERAIRDASARVGKVAQMILRPFSISERANLLRLLAKLLATSPEQNVSDEKNGSVAPRSGKRSGRRS